MDNIAFDIKGCVKNKGTLFIPVTELVKLFERFPYHVGKDYKKLFETAIVSEKVPEINNEETK